MYIDVTDLGLFDFGDNRPNEKTIKTANRIDDYENDRELFLRHISFIKLIEQTNGCIEEYYLFFNINLSKGVGKSVNSSDLHKYYVLKISFNSWYVPDYMQVNKFITALSNYPIIYLDEVADALMQRYYYT